MEADPDKVIFSAVGISIEIVREDSGRKGTKISEGARDAN